MVNRWLCHCLFSILVIFHAKSYGQSLSFENLPFILKGQTAAASLPFFQEVRVIDVRFDTTRLGYAFIGPKFKNLCLAPGTTTGLQQFLNETLSLSKDGNRTLVIFLRTLWMHELKSGEENKEDFNDETKNISRCVIKADLYSYSDHHYQALVRIDTVFQDRRPLREIAGPFLAQALEHMVHNIASRDAQEELKRKKRIGETEVSAYYRNRLNKPRIINDTLQRGLFLTFNDFLNNRPAGLPFTLEQDPESDYLYVTENGQEKLFTDFWGFCDGEYIYIRLGVNFFKLNREQNTYTLWGCRQAIHTTPSRHKNRVVRYLAFGSLANLRSARLRNVIRPMQIDMENGTAY